MAKKADEKTATPAEPSKQAARLEKAQTIIQEIADTGKSLRSVCIGVDVKPSTFLLWVSESPELAEQYARAMQVRADTHFSEIIEISNTPSPGTVETLKEWGVEVKTADMIEHRRLQIDARKWCIARMNPRKYGDRTALEVAGDGGGPLVVQVVNYGGAVANPDPE